MTPQNLYHNLSVNKGPESGKHRKRRSQLKRLPSDKLSLENTSKTVKIFKILSAMFFQVFDP